MSSKSGNFVTKLKRVVEIGRYIDWKVLLLFVLLTRGIPCFSAEKLNDSIEISLLTCSPGKEVYSLYGHTAIRVHDFATSNDLVFNYGIFNFHAPHFVWRFTLGECDYMVIAETFEDFARNYNLRGSYVLEQKLNLTSEEAFRLLRELIVNIQPQNRTYRYNYLTNNCTTKVRDMVTACVDGRVIFHSPFDRHYTYRQMMHEYTEGHPWAELGNDILLGANCDTLLSDEASMFLPFRLAMFFNCAQIVDTFGNLRPLVDDASIVVGSHSGQEEDNWCITPFVASILLLSLCVFVAVLEYCNHRIWWVVDVVLMTAVGLAGCLLCFMFFFSGHPTLNSNWQIWVFNPLPLLCMPWVVIKAKKCSFCAYHYLSMAFLIIFIVSSPWIQQDFSEIVVPLSLSLLTRNVSYCIYYRRK